MATDHPLQILFRASTYEDLLRGCVARRKELGLSQMAVDHISGLQDGYTGKIECGMKGLGRVSLSLYLGALDVEIIAVPKPRRHGTLAEKKEAA